MSSYEESPNRETFPNVAEEIGEDPARFLDRELVGVGDSAPAMLVKARIRGIRKLSTIRAWKAVERALGRGPDDGPREGVMRLLRQREEFIEEHEPNRWRLGPRRPPEWFDTGESDDRERELTALEKVRSGRLATDGGENGR